MTFFVCAAIVVFVLDALLTFAVALSHAVDGENFRAALSALAALSLLFLAGWGVWFLAKGVA